MIELTINDFIVRIQEYYKQEYNDIQIEEIKDLLKKENLSRQDIAFIYNEHTLTSRFLPKKDDIYYILQNRPVENNDVRLHPQSPYQQIYKYKDRSVEDLINRCAYLRQQQNVRQLKSWEISFLVCWENLKDVEENDQHVLKQLIIESVTNNKSELNNFLNKAMAYKYKNKKAKQDESEKRHNKVEHVSQTLPGM